MNSKVLKGREGNPPHTSPVLRGSDTSETFLMPYQEFSDVKASWHHTKEEPLTKESRKQKEKEPNN